MVASENEGLALQVSDVSGQKLVRVTGVPRDSTVGELIQSLLPRMRLPQNVHGDQAAPTYQARLEREGRHLHSSETVGDALQQEDKLVLQPHIVAG